MNKLFNKARYVSVIAGSMAIFGIVGVAPAMAASNANNGNESSKPNVMSQRGGNLNYGQMKKIGPSIFGTVLGISGNVITVSGRISPVIGGVEDRGRFGTSTPVATSTSLVMTYTVNATNAKVIKNNATSSVSAIIVGDTVVVQGTISGTNVTATMIRDGVIRGQGMMNGNKNREGFQNQGDLGQVIGNGQPLVLGTVSAISGAILTITNKSSVTYTVDATNAKIVKGNATSTISSIAVGDSVVVQGTINGNSVVASTVIDQKAPANKVQQNDQGQKKGFFGSIGSFFAHLFGF